MQNTVISTVMNEPANLIDVLHRQNRRQTDDIRFSPIRSLVFKFDNDKSPVISGCGSATTRKFISFVFIRILRGFQMISQPKDGRLEC